MIPAETRANGSHNGTRKTPTSTLGRAYAFIRSERSITTIRRELNRLKLAQASPPLRSAMLMAYPLEEIRRGSSVVLSARETGIYVPAGELRRRGANYFLRLLLPSASNADAAGALGSCISLEKFRLEVFRREVKPVAEVYFRDDRGVYISLSQVERAAEAMARIVSPDAAAGQGKRR